MPYTALGARGRRARSRSRLGGTPQARGARRAERDAPPHRHAGGIGLSRRDAAEQKGVQLAVARSGRAASRRRAGASNRSTAKRPE